MVTRRLTLLFLLGAASWQSQQALSFLLPHLATSFHHHSRRPSSRPPSSSSSSVVLMSTPSERLAKNGYLLQEIATKLEKAGLGRCTIVQDRSLGPGLLNQHYRFETRDAGPVFCKLNDRPGYIRNLEAEMEGLKALEDTHTIRVPKPLLKGMLPDGYSFIAMEFIESIPFGPSIESVARQMGEDLARLHLAPVSFLPQFYGFMGDNYLGLAPQPNEWRDNFATFFIEQRLVPQLEKAAEKLARIHPSAGSDSELTSYHSLERLIQAVRKVLEPVAHVKPSLLHGDLWQGNSGATKNRQPFVYDPACWFGHHEFDLALAGLFGGFRPEFYEAYHSLIPKAEGFEARNDVYRLYHYLNHLNSFGLGFGYHGSTEDPKGYYERAVGIVRSIQSNG